MEGTKVHFKAIIGIASLPVIAFIFLTLLSCNAPPRIEEGSASYYDKSFHGRKTASGEIYDENACTAAHRSLKFGTRVRVTYLKTGKSVKVIINDRGPYKGGRIIDLSRAAANKIGMIDDGVGKVKLEIYD